MTTLERAAVALPDRGRLDADRAGTAPVGSPVAGSLEITSAGVPWSTVLPVAAVLAYADGFWITAMRGAAGAIERSSGPTVSWLRESTLALPFYVGGVLLALMLAVAIVGPVMRSHRALLMSALLVAGAGTVVGSTVLIASSAYDYRLQLDLISVGGAMPGMCATPACLTDQQQQSFDLQLRAVAVGAVLLLLTNLVVVAWVVAARGGRLDLTRVRARSSRTAAVSDAARHPADARTVVLATALVGAAVIHAAVVPEHLEEWTAAGVFFAILTAATVLLAALVVLRPTRLVLAASILASVVPLLLWTVSRSVGMPFGPDPGVPEAVGLADLAACALEVLAVVLAVSLLAGPRARRRRMLSAHAMWAAVAAVVAVTALGLGGTEIAPILQDTGGMDMSAADEAHGA
jgi:hypothetical protein